uniref:Uncharacterized protein n=1 Tax=viral metagenome TaxID=1070528 RepID=A0A6C0LXZ2_9ZZZZ
MELAVPLVALGGLFIVSNQDNRTNNNNRQEGFSNNILPPSQNDPPQKKVSFAPSASNNDAQKVYENTDSRSKYFDGSYQKSQQQNTRQSNVTSLTGETIQTKDFSHNNMQPFFGSKVRGMTSDHNVSEGILDNKNGSGSQNIRKTEQAPLFRPQENMQNANGAPNMNDFYQSRVNPSHKVANVKPFESVQVGPGLNQGYGTEGTNGFNSGMDAREMWQPKNVDEMRVDTNPKMSYSLNNHQGPAVSKIKERGVEGKVEKYTPDTYYENGSDRWFTTTGVEKKQTSRSSHVAKNIQRQNTPTNYQGVALSTQERKSNYHSTAYTPSTKNTYNSPAVGAPNMGGTTGHANIHHEILDNNRSQICENPNIFGFISNTLHAALSPIMDVLQPTRKENAIGNVRAYGDVQVSTPAGYIAETQQSPGVTNRQMYGKSLEHHNVQQQGSGAYETSDHQSIYSNRNETQGYYVGNTGGYNGVAVYDAAYKQTNNESKQVVNVARTNPGNTQRFEPNRHISIAKDQTDRENNRMWVPNNTNYSTPSKDVYGKVDMPSAHTDVANNSRNQPDILDAFKKNPFTHSLHSSV